MKASNILHPPISMPRAVTYKSEYSDTLDRIWDENGRLASLGYFLDTARRWFDGAAGEGNKPRVVILGPDIPEELILAAGERPRWLLGGSLGSFAWSDELVPRDTDPVSRSILGFLHRPDGPDLSEALFIVPLTCDSMRKTAYLLKREGRRLFLVDIPPERDTPRAVEKWQEQMLRMTAAVAEHTGTRVIRRRLVMARKQVALARKTLRAFCELARDREDLLSATARLLVRNSYYYTEDLPEWTRRLAALGAELRDAAGRVAPRSHRPNVLLIGSPVLFPNYKVPFLLGEVGLDIPNIVDETELKLHTTRPQPLSGGREQIIRAIAAEKYALDASAAFVKNDALLGYTESLLRRGEIEGVVWHVLKGQIEYDFELDRFESLFNEYGAPVFRLETDYQYQDVEQLRIRMEAFSEMLCQNRCREVKLAQ